ncbi:GTP cyclohydrolase I FolE [Fuchsiella alkaliacetigena]|uniref:GTP cyclohydrolase I FolE n=1 Tax=Fuchsiella alkaliacetigena TaxID=957042 RepID=UPI00200AA09E|nr:GTP cyclohydrolase I FolE [Fuchsiella alkaliacetigena]MCK8824945.1 GTP cyclohydrolase I FolE [Fuchsiella alkaliacetigena]
MVDKDKIQEAVTMILDAIGEDPEREGLKDTPARVARMYAEIFEGLHKDPAEDLQIFFTEEHEELVLVKNISFYSMCEHHLLPFFGEAHIGYIPKHGKVTGLSKLARVVNSFANRPQLQERLTSQIADLIMDNIDALGVIVIIEAEHMCMTMRGVRKPGSFTTTSAVRGLLQRDQAARAEALKLIKG